MSQYQACLYLFECISHGDSKYCYEIPHNFDIFDNFVTFLNCRLLTPVACKVLKV